MGKRSYAQYCGLAAALDVIGERWALFVVRDLAPGPRRFTDLFDGLPGISTDLLTDRLRSLETAGAVRRREVRTPVPAQLYELTDRGFELARLAGQLARWGAPLLPDLGDADDRVVNARWILQSRASRYRGGLPDGDVHFLIDGTDELDALAGGRCRPSSLWTHRVHSAPELGGTDGCRRRSPLPTGRRHSPLNRGERRGAH